MIDKINRQTGLLERALDACWVKNEVISNNIANAETPGYKKFKVYFEASLNEKKSQFHIASIHKNPKFLPIGKDRLLSNEIIVRRDLSTSMRRDGNNVDIDEENAELAKNSLQYNILSNQLSKELGLIKQAINEGRQGILGLFDSINISASGLTAERLRMDIISQNIANANTTRTSNGLPYRRKMVIFKEADIEKPFSSYLSIAQGNVKKSGVKVSGIIEDKSEFKLVYSPGHPDADENGYVKMPNVDIMVEMVNMISATRAYEANVTSINSTKSMVMKALEIGRIQREDRTLRIDFINTNNLKLLDTLGSSDNKNNLSFSEMLKDSIQKVNQLQLESQNLNNQLVAGNIDNVHQVVIASQKAELALQFTLQVRNKILDAYNEIMRMSI